MASEDEKFFECDGDDDNENSEVRIYKCVSTVIYTCAPPVLLLG